MKSNFFALLSAQVKSQNSINIIRNEKDKKKRRKVIGTYSALALVFIMVIGYSFAAGYGYGYLGMAEILPAFSLAISSVIVFIFTFMKANGYLFAFRDFDMLISLPIKTSTIIAVKFFYMYISNLAFSLCVMLPMGVAYGIWAKPSPLAYVLWLFISLFAPLIPMSIACIFGAIAAAISSRFKFKVVIEVLVSLLFVILIFAINFKLNAGQDTDEFLKSMKNIGQLVKEKLYSLYPVSRWFDSTVNTLSIGSFAMFIAVSAVIFIIFVALVSWKYIQINSALMTTSRHTKFQFSQMQSHSAVHAIMFKELKRFTSSVPYIMNVGMGMILALIASVACAVVGFDNIMTSMKIPLSADKFLYTIPFAIATILTMTSTTSVSLSLEGKNYWILQSLPITKSTIYKGKMLFNIVLIAPFALISVICLAIAVRADIITVLLYALVVCSALIFSTVFGMIIGINFANFNFNNEIEVIKQSSSSMIAIFGNMIFNIVLTICSFFFGNIIGGTTTLLCFCALMLLLSFLIYKLIMKKA